MILKYFSILLCSFAIQPALAAVGNVSVDSSTASGVDTQTSQSGTGGTTTTSSITIFGGYAGDNGHCNTAERSTTSTCNSCSALAPCGGVFQCAERSIHPALNLSVTLSVDPLPTTPQLLVMWGSATSGQPITLTTNPPTSFTAGVPFTVLIPWQDICVKAGWSASCIPNTTATSGTTNSIFVGLGDGSGALASASYQQFTIKLNYVNPADNGSFVNTPTQNPDASQGFTDFQMTPGDGKAFIGDLRRGGTGPTWGSSTKWQSVRVFYAPFTGDVTNSAPDFCQIDYASSNFVDLSVSSKTDVTTQLTDRKVTGLENDQTYMFNIASVDESSIVTEIISPTAMNGLDPTVKENRYVAQPGEVVGLLDDKKCFIATAAFGSQMAPQVELLRQFRNKFLIPNALGREFVHTYYKYSPPLAEFISKHDQLRAAVRGALWPLIYFADLSLQIGFFLTFGLFAAAFLSLILLARRLRRTH